MDLVILNHGQMTRTTPEVALPPPNFRTTPAGGSLTPTIPIHNGSSVELGFESGKPSGPEAETLPLETFEINIIRSPVPGVLFIVEENKKDLGLDLFRLGKLRGMSQASIDQTASSFQWLTYRRRCPGNNSWDSSFGAGSAREILSCRRRQISCIIVRNYSRNSVRKS
ncbi:hypothetical protein AVEN_205000-1 [Araneus ventricosus]|uniref:Uncharacterized protein n=1 Tax=Araneus ventricosus TaxID=182803 RepID=A0A4Y2QY89_ARAVE|nr:hypothetical protein AVEN_205000-1 [Araneus ventricosus]